MEFVHHETSVGRLGSPLDLWNIGRWIDSIGSIDPAGCMVRGGTTWEGDSPLLAPPISLCRSGYNNQLALSQGGHYVEVLQAATPMAPPIGF